MHDAAIERELPDNEVLRFLSAEQLSVLLFSCQAECADLSGATAVALEDCMTTPEPDDLEDRQGLADELINNFRRACEDFLEARRAHGLSSTYPSGNSRNWRIEDNPEYGARAFFEQGTDRDCICIQSGTLDFLLWAALMHVAANETDSMQPIRRRHSGRMTGSLLYAYEIPHDPALRSLAIGMALTAFQFIFFHEVGHLAQGHCRLLATDWSDYRPDMEPGKADPQRQSMELMADIFALRELLKIFQSRREAFEALPSSPSSCFLSIQSRIYTDGSTALCCLSSALACLFYLTSPGGGRHPKREVRFMTLMLSLKKFATFDIFDSDQEWLERLCNVVSRVGDAMQASHPPESKFHFITAPVLEQSNHASFYDEIVTLMAHFEELRPRLVPLARSEDAFVRLDPQPWPSFENLPSE